MEVYLKMEMLVTKFSKGKYKNELELFEEPISAENVKLMGEMIALQALRTVKKYDMKIADKLYIGLIKDLHHMNEIDYIVSDGYDCAQTAMCFLYQFLGRTVHEIYGKDKKGKDITIKLSRFGRNYIEVGQYVDYVFPAFGIRFIAIQDNVDTENRDSGAMEMMPIMNVFNEWHAANTSKKIRAVRRSNALAGIYSAKKATYGYLKGTDKKRTPIIDEETAPVVRRIFELYAAGTSPKNIADILNAENIPSPGKLAYERLGHKGRPNEMRLWCEVSIRFMLNNIMYIGHLPMLQETTVSYKNHKRQAKDRSDWVITYNNHEPIISQELWDRVQERQKHMAQGRKTRDTSTRFQAFSYARIAAAS